MGSLAFPVTPLLKKVSRKLRGAHARLYVASRKALARTIYAMPPLQHRDPRRKLVTFKAHCKEITEFPFGPGAAPTDWYLPLRSAEIVRRAPSISVDATQATAFRVACELYQDGATFEIPELFLASLARAKVLTPSLVTFSPDNRIFLDSALSKPEILETHGILDTVVHPCSERLAGDYCLLGTPWSSGYYHWLVEALPRLAQIERFPALFAAKLIVNAPLARFQRDSLALAGINNDRLTSLGSSFTEIERLYFVQIPAPTGNPSPHAVAWLRARFLPQARTSNLPATRKLYITRKDAPQRRLLNEDDVIRVLERDGFEVVSLNGMPFLDQVRLFSEARMIVAPHGAGVTNILFSPPGATVVEFFGNNYINGCYWALANICGHRHAFLIGEPVRLDYRISLPEFARLLAQLSDN